MQPTDFARKSLGGAYLNRTDTLFDKAFNQNGKVNSFVTKDGIVQVGGFEIQQNVPAGKNRKKMVKTYYDFADIKGNAKKLKQYLHLICQMKR